MEFYKQRIVFFTIIIFLITIIGSIFPTFINNQLNIQPVILNDISDKPFLIKSNNNQILITSIKNIKNKSLKEIIIYLINNREYNFKREYWFDYFPSLKEKINIYIKSKFIDINYKLYEYNDYFILELIEIYSKDKQTKFYKKVNKDNQFIKNLFLLNKILI